MNDLLTNNKTCPKESIYQIGTVDESVSGETLAKIATEFFAEMEEKFGSHVHILDWALHLDEGTPHIHERHVFDCENKYGELCPQQEKALEELGIERESQYTIETVYMVIDERYKSGKPFIITTNIQLDALRNPQDLEHARIYDRIMERCMPVFFGGKNYRSGLGQGNRDMAKKVLTGTNGIV